MTTVPGCRVWPAGAASLASTSTATGLLPSVSAASSLAVGASGVPPGDCTTTVTVPGADSAPASSVTVYRNRSVPANDPAGVYVTTPVVGLTASVPWAGGDTI